MGGWGGYRPKCCFLFDKYFMYVLALFDIFVHVEDFYLSKFILSFLFVVSLFYTDSFS